MLIYPPPLCLILQQGLHTAVCVCVFVCVCEQKAQSCHTNAGSRGLQSCQDQNDAKVKLSQSAGRAW